jgi:hypothetical protein
MTTYQFESKTIQVEQASPAKVSYLPDEIPLTLWSDSSYHQEVSTQASMLPFTTVKSMDCGGDGDCFFRSICCLNQLYLNDGLDFLKLEIPQFYQILSLKLSTWIEDTHISKLCSLIEIQVVILSKVEDKAFISKFGFTGPKYYLENLGNYHYKALISPEIYEEVKYLQSINLISLNSQISTVTRHFHDFEDHFINHPSYFSSFPNSDLLVSATPDVYNKSSSYFEDKEKFFHNNKIVVIVCTEEIHFFEIPKEVLFEAIYVVVKDTLFEVNRIISNDQEMGHKELLENLSSQPLGAKIDIGFEDLPDFDPQQESEEPMRWGDYFPEEENVKEAFPNKLFPISPNPTLQCVYSYMRNISLFSCETEEEAILCFKVLHYTILDIVNRCGATGKYLPSEFLKHYYKFRHEIFCYLCLRGLGIISLGTDTPLSKWIKSDKTPDFILERDEFNIFEFTVANRYGVADFNKGGGIFDVKYSKEAEQLQEVTGKRVKVNIVAAILDSYNISDVIEAMSPFTQVNEERMRDFFEICNQFKNSISNAYFSAGFEKTGVKSIQGVHESPGMMSTIMLDPKLVGAIFKNWDGMFHYLERLSNKRNKPVKIAFKYDKENGSTSLDIHPSPRLKCLTLLTATEILRDKKFNEALSNLNFYSGSTPIGINEVRGDVPVTIRKPRFKADRYNWSYPVFVGNAYCNEKIMVRDEYSKLDYIDEDQLSTQASLKFNFPENYFDKLLFGNYEKVIASSDKCFLANNFLTEEYLIYASEVFEKEYVAQNSKDFKMHSKQTFMIPLVTMPLKKSPLDDFCHPFMQNYIDRGTGAYTKLILNKVIKSDFVKSANPESETSKIRDEYSESRSVYYFKINTIRKGARYSQLTSKEQLSLVDERNTFLAKQRVYSKHLGTLKKVDVRVVKVPCSKNHPQRTLFESEMTHFDKGSKGLRGIGLIRHPENVQEYFSNLFTRMTESGFHKISFPPLYNQVRGPGPDFLTKDKDFYTGRWNEFFEANFSGTLIEQLAMVGSNLSKLLFNEGTKTYNSQYVKVDNLGFKDLVVLVRGGPKNNFQNLSRLFKIIFYMDKKDVTYSGYRDNQFFEIIDLGDKLMVCTPWSHLHLDVLYDWFSLRERVFMNLYSNHVRSGIPLAEKQDHLNVLPSVLSFHNRRKTEQLLHNVRYLIVNPMGEFSNLHSIMKSFATLNLSYFDGWLKESLRSRYLEFSKTIMEISKNTSRNFDKLLISSGLKDLWFNQPFRDTNQMTSFIYITYMMTKAPVNASVEQAINLKEILQDVDYYSKHHGNVKGMDDESHHIDIFDFKGNEYQEDFNYDPTFCQFLGFYGSGILRNRCDPYELENAWKGFSNMGISKIANSNGLRGFNENNYFSRKGYEVVYDWVIEALDNQDLELNQIVEEYLSMDLKSASEKVRADKMKCSEIQLDKATFHIVHKLQRGGNREIFCMDFVTKSRQAPVEKFWAYLCSKMQNEFISIPSSKRHAMIHTDFFEKKTSFWVKTTLRWVLDCRRWAPHSVVQKYLHFLHGLSGILPQDFVDWCEDLLLKVLDKEFVTRGHVMKTVLNNKSYTGLLDFIREDTTIKDKYNIKVKFSFVMGIFNYMSSFMHAINQMVASEIVMSYNLSNGNGLVLMDPKAHSDDSVITSYHENDSSVYPTVKLYDWVLKCSNHMLSVKKSQVNRNVYLEFLSILYLFDRFVPVIPKFMSSIPFKPTDQGYSSDVGFAITQSIEVLSNGGTTEEAFLILKLTEAYIQKIYNLTPHPSLPYNFLGMIDAHPTELLLSGSQSEIVKSKNFAPDLFWKAYNFLASQGLIEGDDPLNISVKWDMTAQRGSRIRNKYARFDQITEKLSKMHPWTLERCNLGNEALSLIWFLNKLKDPKYYSSMIMEPDSRRFSRAFGSANYRNVYKSDGSLVSVQSLTVVLRELDSIEVSNSDVNEDLNQMLDHLSSDLISWHQAVEGSEWSKIIKPNGFKDKPVHFSFSTPELGSVRIRAEELVSYVHEPDAFGLLGLVENPKNEVKKILSYIESIGIETSRLTKEQLFLVTQKILGRNNRGHRLIASVPSQYKRLDTYSGLIVFLCHNSVKGLIRECVNISASRVDWKKRVMSGRVPESVLDYLEVDNVFQMVKSKNLLSLDIFKKDLTLLRKEVGNDIPTEWKPLVMSATSEHQHELANENYWVWWVKDQVKVGKVWYGEGSCIVKVPEALIQFNINNGSISKITVQEKVSTTFSSTTGWFLKNLTSISGMSLMLTPREYGDPNNLYYGLHINSNTYGIGPPSKFDMISNDPVENADLLKGFMTNECFIEKRGRYHEYQYNRQKFKIEFLVPTTDMPNINLDKYIDKAKIKKSILVPEVRDFLYMMSEELRSEYAYDRAQVMDTIGYSKFYKILYDSSVRNALINGTQIEEPILKALFEWKKTHVDFQFPDEEEVAELARRTDLPNIPSKIYTYIVSIGKSTIGKDEFIGIITNMLSMDEDRRIQYILSMFPNLNDAERHQALVLSIRDTRLYDSCKFLGSDTFRILTPLCEVLLNCVDAGVKSFILSDLTRSFSGSHRMISDSQTLKLILSKLVINGMSCMKILSNSDRLAALFYDILTELCDNELGKKMEILSTNISILRSVKFDVEPDKLLHLFMDVLDSLYISRWYNKPPTRNEWAKKDEYEKETSFFKKTILQIASQDQINSIKIKTTGKTGRSSYLTVPVTEPQPGVFKRPFVPLNETDKDELDAGCEYDSDIEEDLEYEEVGTAAQVAFVKRRVMDQTGIWKTRGSGFTTFVLADMITRDVLKASGKLIIFIKKDFSSIFDFLNNFGNTLLCFTQQKKNFTVETFERKDWMDFFKLESKHKPELIEIGGEKYEKLALLKDTVLNMKLDTIDQYFKRVTLNTAGKVLDEMETNVDKLKEINVVVSEEFDEKKDELFNKIEEFRHPKTKEQKEHNFLEEIKEMLKTFDVETPKIEREQFQMHDMKYENPIGLLRDPEMLGEFNALFPGLWDKLERNELFLTQASKRSKLKAARATLSEKRNDIGALERYSKLYLITKALLESVQICKSHVHQTHELSQALDVMWNDDEQDLDIDNLAAYLTPQTGEFIREIDVDRLF